METKYSKRENIKDGKLDDEEKKMIRDQIEILEPGVHLYAVSYEKQPELEAKGWDIRMVRLDGSESGIEYKKRRPKWMDHAGMDFTIETYDGNRPDGKGWFILYADQGIAYLIFLWKSCKEQDEKWECTRNYKCRGCEVERTRTHMSIFSNNEEQFFIKVQKLNEDRQYKSYKVLEYGMDNVCREVGGFILPLYDIIKLRVFDTRDTPLNEYWKDNRW
ncbi:MAG TPA: hypothetical protein VMW42_11810 [Desulfatiglandales bacterium]|nr:hypothetical protein [Desulfatiglandales bacterium]